MRPQSLGEDYAAARAAGRGPGARPLRQAYHRRMTDTQGETAAAEAPEGLRPLLGTLSLLGGDGAGYCSDGVCHIPAPAVRQGE